MYSSARERRRLHSRLDESDQEVLCVQPPLGSGHADHVQQNEGRFAAGEDIVVELRQLVRPTGSGNALANERSSPHLVPEI